MLIGKKIPLLFFAIFFLGVVASFGQKYKVMGSYPGTTITCPAGHENMHSRVGTSGKNGLMNQKKATSTARPTSEIRLIFRGDEARDQGFRNACRHAANIWERYIVSPVPIVIEIRFEDLGSGVLASAGATRNFRLADDAYPDGRIFPIALANALLERDLAPNQPDIRVTVNSHGSTFIYYIMVRMAIPGHGNMILLPLCYMKSVMGWDSQHPETLIKILVLEAVRTHHLDMMIF